MALAELVCEFDATPYLPHWKIRRRTGPRCGRTPQILLLDRSPRLVIVRPRGHGILSHFLCWEYVSNVDRYSGLVTHSFVSAEGGSQFSGFSSL